MDSEQSLRTIIFVHRIWGTRLDDASSLVQSDLTPFGPTSCVSPARHQHASAKALQTLSKAATGSRQTVVQGVVACTDHQQHGDLAG